MILFCLCGQEVVHLRKGRFISVAVSCWNCGLFNRWDSSNTLMLIGESHAPKESLSNDTPCILNRTSADPSHPPIPLALGSSAVSDGGTQDKQNTAELRHI